MRRIPEAILILSLLVLARPAWPEPVRVTGRIVPPRAPDARIELRRVPQGSTGQPGPAPVTARPASDGSFELMAPEPGLYRLIVQAKGFLLSEVVPVLEETDRQVWLRPAGSPGEAARRPATSTPAEIRKGRVLDSVTQAPLPGALVWQAGLDAGEDVPWTWTAADGSFRLALRGPDPAIGAAAAGHVTISSSNLDAGGPPTLALRPAVTLAGQIVDPEGRPVAGASIDVFARDPGPTGWQEDRQTRAGADGRFVLRGLPPERAYQLSVDAKGFVSTWNEVALGEPGQGIPPVRIVLSRGITLTGRVVDPAGQPVAGADLELGTAADGPEGAEFSMFSRMRGASETTGRFRFDHVGRGEYSLRVLRPGFAAAYRSGTVGTRSQAVVDLGDLTLKPGVAIEGHVTDPRGTPVEGAGVLASVASERSRTFAPKKEPTLTGPDGFFRVDDLEEGRSFNLAIQKSGYALVRLPGVEAPTKEPLQIELRPARSLSGRVLDAERRPVAGAGISRVEVYETGMVNGSSGGRSSAEVGRTDQEGRFVLSDLEAGSFRLAIRAPGFRPAELSGLRIPEDEEPAPLEVVLERGAVLEGRVLDGKGQPVRHAGIQTFSSESRPFAGSFAQTDEQGQYRIEGLGPGEHRVEAQASGSVLRAEGKVVLEDAGPYLLDLRLPSGVDVSGRVLDERGEPLGGAGLSLQPLRATRAWSDLSARSAADGSFRFPDVPDGTYQLSGTAPGVMSQAAPDEVLVAGREISGLVLRLARGGTITGRVSGIAQENRNMLHIEAVREEDGESAGMMASDRTYRLSVAPGTWRMTASLPSGPAATGTASVRVGEEVVLDLEMPRGLTLSGRVLVDGQALPEAQVSAMGSPEPGAASVLSSVRTRYDGSFAFQGLRPGPLTLTVFSQGIHHVQALDLAADRQITVEIVTGRLSGSILSATGEPVEGVLVALRGEDRKTGIWTATAQARTDERGAFEVSRLAAGSYRVTAEAPGFGPASQTVVVTPGGTTHVQVVLEPAP